MMNKCSSMSAFVKEMVVNRLDIQWHLNNVRMYDKRVDLQLSWCATKRMINVLFS